MQHKDTSEPAFKFNTRNIRTNPLATEHKDTSEPTYNPKTKVRCLFITIRRTAQCPVASLYNYLHLTFFILWLVKMHEAPWWHSLHFYNAFVTWQWSCVILYEKRWQQHRKASEAWARLTMPLLRFFKIWLYVRGGSSPCKAKKWHVIIGNNT